MPSTLLIVHPYLPSYRIAFFSALRERLKEFDLDLHVANTEPPASRRHRADAVNLEWSDSVNTRWFHFGSRELGFRNVFPLIRTLNTRYIVVEQAIRNLETYLLLANKNKSVATWGHGGTYCVKRTPFEEWIKRQITLRADWFFAYTESGLESVSNYGYPRDRATVLYNSIDVRSLRHQLEAIPEDDVDAFRHRHGLVSGRTALFSGALDNEKDIPLLLAVANRLKSLSGFRLLIEGQGPAFSLVVEAALQGSPVVALGRGDGMTHALHLKTADLMLIPKKVGLVAVDALAAGMPLVTTRSGGHAPEFEYLTEGQTTIATEYSAESLAAAVRDLILNSSKLRAMRTAALADGSEYSVERMVENFVEGVKCWLEIDA